MEVGKIEFDPDFSRKLTWPSSYIRMCRLPDGTLIPVDMRQSRQAGGPVPQPWCCPRCQRINAPHVDHCTCAPSGEQA